MTDAIPQFAIVGHPNEGKSSVVATLAEDDQVRISEIPGETVVARVYPVRVDGEEILRFTDTPGFQHPQQMLEWMKARADSASGLARDFVDAHRAQPQFAQDLELLLPLAEGSGVIYVVDGSRPVRAHDLAEMEILRLCGNARMALINPKEDETAFLDEWKSAAARCFNSIRTFNAIRATYAERIALLESLKSINQDWEPALARAIDAFRADWTRRNQRVAGVICDVLRRALTHVESRNVFNPGEEESAKTALVGDYQRAIAKLEQRAQADIRSLYKHNVFRLELPEQSVLREDLFTEKTWQLLGLNKKQIITAAAILGAGAGVKLDLIFAHMTFGLFTLSGAALGAAAAWFKGENMARARVKQLKLGGVQVSVGPNQNPQFPFVLIDRLLLYYQSVINWAHARRDQPTAIEISHETKAGYTARWTNDQRKVGLNFIKSLARDNPAKQDEAERELQKMIEDLLPQLGEDAKGQARIR